MTHMRVILFCTALVACTIPPPQSEGGSKPVITNEVLIAEPEHKEPEKKPVQKKVHRPAVPVQVPPILPPCPPADDAATEREKIIRKLDCLVETN